MRAEVSQQTKKGTGDCKWKKRLSMHPRLCEAKEIIFSQFFKDFSICKLRKDKFININNAFWETDLTLNKCALQ